MTEITPLSAELSSLLAETTAGRLIYIADNCIDNNAATTCHTAQTQLPYPWLALDLGPPRKVKKVVIVNRNGCCGADLRDLEVRVSNTKPSFDEGEVFAGGNLLGNFYGWGETGQEINVEQEMAIIGRYVVVQHNVRRFYMWSGCGVEWIQQGFKRTKQQSLVWLHGFGRS